MKVLWITPVITPEASELFDTTVYPMGSWIHANSSLFVGNEKLELVIASPLAGEKNYRHKAGEKIEYYVYKPFKSNGDGIENLEIILKNVYPDLVHIYGTELSQCFDIVKLLNVLNIKFVINIQGLTSIIAQHYYSGIPVRYRYGFTLRNILKMDNVYFQKRYYEKIGKREELLLKETSHVIGRSSWDYACTKLINKNINYHYCNETLRNSFYNETWEIDECIKHQIFISQAYYPIKGFHTLLKALNYVKKEYSDVKVIVSGSTNFNNKTLKQKLKNTIYSRYISFLLKKYSLVDSVEYTGVLNEEDIKNKLLNSHLFVSPSTIENESNSLSEARILGLPCICSYVGGTTDRIKHGEDGFYYQHDADYMLAHYIMTLFNDADLAVKFSKNSRIEAQHRNDKNKNLNTILNIYNNIVNDIEM